MPARSTVIGIGHDVDFATVSGITITVNKAWITYRRQTVFGGFTVEVITIHEGITVIVQAVVAVLIYRYRLSVAIDTPRTVDAITNTGNTYSNVLCTEVTGIALHVIPRIARRSLRGTRWAEDTATTGEGHQVVGATLVAVDAGETTLEVAACLESENDLLHEPTPETVGSLEALLPTALDPLVELVHKPIQRRLPRPTRPIQRRACVQKQGPPCFLETETSPASARLGRGDSPALARLGAAHITFANSSPLSHTRRLLFVSLAMGWSFWALSWLFWR